MAICGIRQYAKGYRYKTASQPQLLLIYLLQGELLFSSPDQWVRLGQGFVGVFPKHAAFYLECTKDFRGLYISFEDQTQKAIFQSAYGVEGDTPIKVVAELLRMELLKEVLSTTIIHALCESFAELTVRLIAPVSQKNDQKSSLLYIQKAEEKMQSNLYSKLPVETLLDGLGIGYRQFSRYFTELKGATPKQFFINLKMQEACRLLKESTFSVTTIAHELGFASSQHLSTQFKQIFGDTPKNWQRNH